MKRTRAKPPSKVGAKIRPGSGRRRLIAAKAGRSGRRNTARRIEEIIRRTFVTDRTRD